TPASRSWTVASVRVGEIRFDPPGPDGGSNTELNREWIRLHNAARRAVWLGGWSLLDARSHRYRFRGLRLGPGASVEIHSGRGRNTATDRYWGRKSPAWGNAGDRATLRRRDRTVADRCSYG